MDTQALYRQRSALFLNEIRPYLHYALQGAAVSAGLAFLLGAIGYRQFLLWVHPAFPWELLVTAVMLIALAGGRIRTYLQEADTLFLLPREHAMDAYLRTAVNRALLKRIVAVVAAWLLVWPVYHKLTPSGGWMFVVILAIWLAFAYILTQGKWLELQLQERRSRLGFAALRWSMSAAGAYALFVLHPLYGILVFALLAIAYLAGLRLARKYIVNWGLLIDMERTHKGSVYRTLNWFIDVPAVQGKARNMHWLDWAVRPGRFRRDRAYPYLYTLVWLRSELFGIIVRLTVVGVILLALVPGDITRVIIYAVFAGFGALQLADLKRYYREHLWVHIYPLPAALREHAVNRVRLSIHTGMLLLLAIPTFITIANPLWAASVLLVSAAASALYHRYR
ncbi:ABC transporter permease [Paenibacillus xerothermodurans]|uniref:ABC transporter permease n=1 Tax=Paenibacillus xerothermodurans TaxID=1977292 RepID=A0A2W1N924_PAEXE|nr:ABC transporter permease [Paenibacillus xerothermodurans]PZE20424.1 ABC transporter permease [Paenibacillus xerothermodurans]